MEVQGKPIGERIIESLEKPMSTVEIAKRFNLSRDFVYHILETYIGRKVKATKVYPERGHMQIYWEKLDK